MLKYFTGMAKTTNYQLQIINYKLVVFSFLLLLYSCKTIKISETPKAIPSKEVVIKLIQVNDVYEIAPLSGGLYGGMARVAHISDSIKKQFPNSYLVMAGDFLNPSLLGTLKVNGERVKGKQMVEVMNAMDFDVVTFGNHEFDLKEKELQLRLNESEFQWTSANVYQQRTDGPRVFSVIKNNDSIPIPETLTFDIDYGEEAPLRIGFFSVTIDSNPKDFVYYADYMLEARSAVASLESAATDIILGLTHLKVAEDQKLAMALKEVDFIMGGHEHNNMLVPTINATIAKADSNAKSIYVHTLTYNLDREELIIDSQLVTINNKVPSLPKVKVIVDKWEDILETEIKEIVDAPKEVILTTKTPLNGTDAAGRTIQTDLGTLIAAAAAKGFKQPTSYALVNAGSFRLDDMLPKKVTSIDVFRVLPFGGNFIKIEITGNLFIKMLDHGISRKGTGGYLQRYGVAKNKKGEWEGKNGVINPTVTYTVAISDYLLNGSNDMQFLTKDNPEVLKITLPQSHETAIDVRKAVIAHMKTISKLE